MRSLVQPWGRVVHCEVRPQRVDDSFAVQPAVVGEREQRNQCRALSPRPHRIRDGDPVELDGESAEQANANGGRVHGSM